MTKKAIVFTLVGLLIAGTLAACAQLIGIEDLPELCGDGVKQPEEACDDGNTTSGDGCNAACTSDETCGNGIRDLSEICDDSGNSSRCDADCSVAVCGDAFVNPEADERCEDGNSVAGDGCIDCRLECGNGVMDRNEQCDGGDTDSDGYADDNAECDGDCTTPTCGDEYTNAALEACDDGNQVDGDGCSAACLSNESCGNGYRDTVTGESCDEGDANGDEMADDTGSCDRDCTVAQCGDGYVNAMANEQCDDGADNSDLPNSACRPDCGSRRCGDGIVDELFGEFCDDGNSDNSDQCPDGLGGTCQPASCGDGFVHSGMEICDPNSPEPICIFPACNPDTCRCDDGSSVTGNDRR
jgi:cysteine-rich repeat protein